MTLVTATNGPSWDPVRLSILDSITVPLASTASAGAMSATDARRSEASRLADGSVINGRYRVAGVLGEGGMGIVYAVDDLHDAERRIALKTIHRTLLRPERLDLFRAEFKTMAELEHPNVARVYDFERDRGANDWFFTMELLEGPNLLRATQDADVESILDRIVQVCRALAYMHTRGVVHYDLKPSNISVVGATVKVLDFGLVGANPGARAIGTPAFMAPEMFGAACAPDGRSDLYSLGITIYHLFSRKVPFSATSLIELAQKHAKDPVSFAAHGERVPVWLRPIVERLCAKEPAERYPNANAVIADINRRGQRHFAIETEETTKSYVLASRFVGRGAELERVREHVMTRVHSESPSGAPLLLIGGISGVGKSRLMREVKQHVQLAGMPFLHGDCYASDLGGVGAFAECLRQALRLAQAVGHLDLIDEFGQSLACLVPELPFVTPIRRAPPTSLSPELERRALLDRAAEFFVSLSTRVPLVLYVNDLQWGGPNATDLAALLVRNLRLSLDWERPARLAFIASYRNDEIDGRPIEKLLAEQGVERLVLKPLDEVSVRALTASMLGSDVPIDIVSRFMSGTGGVPFFVEEAMRMLVDCGLVYQHAGEWRADAGWRELDLPDVVGGAFERRVERLSPEARALLEAVAVHDHPISIPVLARVLESSRDELGTTLLALEERQYLERLPDGEAFTLAHARMRDALLNRLDERALRDLHRRLGDALEEESGDAAAYKLAHHFYHAGVREKAVRYGLLGGAHARSSNAPDTALTLYRSVLELMSEEERRSPRGRGVRLAIACLAVDLGQLRLVDEQTAAILDARDSEPVERAEALLTSAMRWNIRFHWREAIRRSWLALGELGQPRARTRLGVFFVVLRGMWEFLRPAKNKAKEVPHLELIVRVYAQLVESYMMLGSLGLLISFRACALARRSTTASAAKAGIMNTVALCLIILGRRKAAMRLAAEALDVSNEIDGPFERASSLATFGIVHWLEGEYSRARERIEEARVHMLKHGFSHRISQVYAPYLNLLLDQGAYRHFSASMSEVQQVAQRTQSSCMSVLIGGGVMARACLGEYDKAERDRADATSFLESVEPAVALNYRLSMMFWFGNASLAAGQIESSIQELREAVALQRRARVPLPLIPNLDYYLARALFAKLRRQGELSKKENRELARAVAACRRIANRAVPYRLQSLVVSAAFAAWNRKRERAAKQGEVLRVLSQECGADSLSASADFEIGSALVATGQDRSEGTRRLERALLAFEAMGAHGLADRARELLADENSVVSGYATSA